MSLATGSRWRPLEWSSGANSNGDRNLRLQTLLIQRISYIAQRESLLRHQVLKHPVKNQIAYKARSGSSRHSFFSIPAKASERSSL